ncbi:hypothetical protein EMCRGX_G008528 [Ephydatia muelleri]
MLFRLIGLNPKSTTKASLNGRLSMTLVRVNVKALLSRANTLNVLPHYFNIIPVLRSFSKLAPQVCVFQHFIDAADVPSILQSLKGVVNILVAGRAPPMMASFLAGGNLTALVKSMQDSSLDIRPIAVGEALRRLTGKCLCALMRSKASEFFQPHQVACPMRAEKIVHGLRAYVLFCCDKPVYVSVPDLVHQQRLSCRWRKSYYFSSKLVEFPTALKQGDRIRIKFSGDGAKFSSTTNILILSFSILHPQTRYLSGAVCTRGEVCVEGGPTPAQGTVGTCFRNQWGTVCDTYWTDADAKVVCGQLGYTDGHALSGSYYGPGSASNY